jgi:coenzyme F420-reducing hydrogenase gamma subunit
MKDRTFSLVQLTERDGSIEECRLDITVKREIVLRLNLSKREMEYLIWLLADARKDMKYTNDEPRLFESLEVSPLVVKVDDDLILKGCPPPNL